MEYQDFPSEKISHSAEYFVGQPCCSVFQKSSGSENFINKGGEYQDFPSKNFSFTVPKKFVGQPCCAVVRNFPVAKNFMDKGGGIKIFRGIIFLSQCRKFF